MFETSGTTDVMEKSSWPKYALTFVAGCLFAILIVYMLVMPSVKRAAAASAEDAAQKKFSAELEKNPVEAQLQTAKSALQTASQERDACNAKFDRQTILYDSTFVGDPTQVWIIPADVEPIVVGDHPVMYSHYDPKTKRETVRFHPKKQ
jgi:hypothetical protein